MITSVFRKFPRIILGLLEMIKLHEKNHRNNNDSDLKGDILVYKYTYVSVITQHFGIYKFTMNCTRWKNALMMYIMYLVNYMVGN